MTTPSLARCCWPSPSIQQPCQPLLVHGKLKFRARTRAPLPRRRLRGVAQREMGSCRTSPHNHAAVHPGAPLATQRCPWQEWKPASKFTAEACAVATGCLLLRLHGFRCTSVCGHVTELLLLLATTPTCCYRRWFRWRNCCWAGQSLLRPEPCSNHARMQMITCPGG